MKYDDRTDGDMQGEYRGMTRAQHVKEKGKKYGIESKGKEYFPKSPIEHEFKQISQIKPFMYPDQPEDKIDEQEESVKYASGQQPKKYYRT